MLLQAGKAFWGQGAHGVWIVEDLKLIGPTLRVIRSTNFLRKALALNCIGIGVESHTDT